MTLAEVGRFAEVAEPASEAIRLAAPLQDAYVVGWAHLTHDTVHLLRGDWAKARPGFEHAIAVVRAGYLPLLLSLSVALWRNSTKPARRLAGCVKVSNSWSVRSRPGTSAISDGSIHGWVELRCR